MVLAIRALLFYMGYISSVIIWGPFATLTGLLLPYRARLAYVIGIWTRFVLWWLRITCNIRCEIAGKENLETGPGILFVKHQSTWDALFIQTLVTPQTTVIKKSLLWIPCFGWAFSITQPIAINRAQPHSALRKLIEDGRVRLNQGVWVSLFPEGTRLASGETAKFQPGGAMLAAMTEMPVFIIAHNAGQYWPVNKFIKHAGVINVRISPRINTKGKSAKEILSLSENWLLENMQEIDPCLKKQETLS